MPEQLNPEKCMIFCESWKGGQYHATGYKPIIGLQENLFVLVAI